MSYLVPYESTQGDLVRDFQQYPCDTRDLFYLAKLTSSLAMTWISDCINISYAMRHPRPYFNGGVV